MNVKHDYAQLHHSQLNWMDGLDCSFATFQFGRRFFWSRTHQSVIAVFEELRKEFDKKEVRCRDASVQLVDQEKLQFKEISSPSHACQLRFTHTYKFTNFGKLSLPHILIYTSRLLFESSYERLKAVQGDIKTFLKTFVTQKIKFFRLILNPENMCYSFRT